MEKRGYSIPEEYKMKVTDQINLRLMNKMEDRKLSFRDNKE